ncbi:MAG: hypothetical protein H7Y22_14285 [Gemmatimonadaceae bacterium]|nr:hypothetical protein [Gloeobacterales cyanobacterium ES-bin-141]
MIDPERLEKAMPDLVRRSGWTNQVPEQPVDPLAPTQQRDWHNVLSEPVPTPPRRVPWKTVGVGSLVAALLVFAILPRTVLQNGSVQPLPEVAPRPRSPAPERTEPPAPTARPPADTSTSVPQRRPTGPTTSGVQDPTPPRKTVSRPEVPSPSVSRGTTDVRPRAESSVPPLVEDSSTDEATTREYAADLCLALRNASAALPESGGFAQLEVLLQAADSELRIAEPVRVVQAEGETLIETARQTLRAWPVRPAPDNAQFDVLYRVTLYSQPGLVTCEPDSVQAPQE